MQGPAPASTAWSGRKKAVVAVALALLFGALVALVLHYRKPMLTTSHLHGASECAQVLGRTAAAVQCVLSY